MTLRYSIGATGYHIYYRGHLVVKHSAVSFQINGHVRAQMNKLHLTERKNPNIQWIMTISEVFFPL